MWFVIDAINKWFDPQKAGDKYESNTNDEYVLVYIRNDGTEDEPVFVFKASTGVEVSLDRTALTTYYRRWKDPYAPQKALAAKHGFVWKDEPDAPTPKTRIDF